MTGFFTEVDFVVTDCLIYQNLFCFSLSFKKVQYSYLKQVSLYELTGHNIFGTEYFEILFLIETKNNSM